MKSLLSSFIYYLLGFFAAFNFVNGIVFNIDPFLGVFLLVLGLSLINSTSKPITHLFSMPTNGFGKFLISFSMNLAALFLISNFTDFFAFRSGFIPSFSIIGYNISSYRFGSHASIALSAFLITIVVSFLEWLAPGKKR